MEGIGAKTDECDCHPRCGGADVGEQAVGMISDADHIGSGYPIEHGEQPPLMADVEGHVQVAFDRGHQRGYREVEVSIGEVQQDFLLPPQATVGVSFRPQLGQEGPSVVDGDPVVAVQFAAQKLHVGGHQPVAVS
jgi:hypothetical protein